jgi:type I restriction enzyme M protein
MGTMESRKLRIFTDEDIDKVAETYHAWRNLPNKLSSRAESRAYENVDGYCYAATVEEVQKQDYKLTPGIYVGTEEVEDDGILFEDKMKALQTTLQEQFAKGNELQKKILENFNKI